MCIRPPALCASVKFPSFPIKETLRISAKEMEHAQEMECARAARPCTVVPWHQDVSIEICSTHIYRYAYGRGWWLLVMPPSGVARLMATSGVLRVRVCMLTWCHVLMSCLHLMSCLNVMSCLDVMSCLNVMWACQCERFMGMPIDLQLSAARVADRLHTRGCHTRRYTQVFTHMRKLLTSYTHETIHMCIVS